MNKENILSVVLTIILLLILTSCSGVTYEQIYPTLGDGKYDSEFPYKGSSAELEKICQSVHRITTTAFYKTYTFSIDDSLTSQSINEKDLETIALVTGYADQSSSGSATTILSSEGKVVLLTCAHVVDSPDTLFSYFYDDTGIKSKFIQSLLIKDNQTVYAAGFPEGSRLEILATDNKNDLALIGRDYHNAISNYKLPYLNYPNGKAKEIEWGTFVYIFGYPVGYKMVTKAIVSSPNRDSKNSFIIDAVINQGASGSAVLAIKDGVPNFEFVGMVQWVPEEEEDILVPSNSGAEKQFNPLVSYGGDLFVKRHSSIQYGIANVISIEAISEFITENASSLNLKKYDLDSFLKR